MHLNNPPVYFIKGSDRQAAYYTVQVREFLADGWTQEQPSNKEDATQQPVATEPEPMAEALQDPVMPQQEEAAKDLGEMTKTELVAYAEANGIQFKQYATKSEILEACQAAQNG